MYNTVAEPISLQDVKIHLKIDEEEVIEDEMLCMMITAAREYCENYTGRSLVPKADGSEITIPEGCKQAMLMMIGHWYANREAVLIGSISKHLEFSTKALLDQYRVRWWD